MPWGIVCVAMSKCMVIDVMGNDNQWYCHYRYLEVHKGTTRLQFHNATK